MADYNEPSELDVLNSEISTLKQILSGIKSSKLTLDESRSAIVSYIQRKGDNDGFLKPDPGVEVRNIYHTSVKGSGGGGGGGGGVSGGGGGSGSCCVVL